MEAKTTCGAGKPVVGGCAFRGAKMALQPITDALHLIHRIGGSAMPSAFAARSLRRSMSANSAAISPSPWRECRPWLTPAGMFPPATSIGSSRSR